MFCSHFAEHLHRNLKLIVPLILTPTCSICDLQCIPALLSAEAKSLQLAGCLLGDTVKTNWSLPFP